MERITTPTAEVDKFGAGKNGFKGGGPPNATQLSPEWFDNVQEETSRVIEGQGIILDGAQLDQLQQAIDDYIFQDPSILGTLTVESGGALEIASGGALTTDVGSTSTFNGAVVIGPTGQFTCNATAITNFAHSVNLGTSVADTITTNGAAAFMQLATFNLGIALLAQTLLGGVGSVVDVETGKFLTAEFDDAGILLPPNPRGVRFAETTLVVQGDDAVVRSVSVPDRGFDASFVTGNAIDTTTAVCGRRLQETEQVWLRVTLDYNHTLGVIGDLNTRIQINGPGVIDVNTKSYELKAAGGFRWQPLSFVFPWTPTDDFVAPGTTAYSFTVRIGSSLGNSLNVRDIGIEVVSNVRV